MFAHSFEWFGWLAGFLWFTLLLPGICLIGIVSRIRARRALVAQLQIQPEGLWVTVYNELTSIIADPKDAFRAWRRWGVGRREIPVREESETLTTEEAMLAIVDRELAISADNGKLGIGPEKGDLLEACPLCGHWLVTRTKAKMGLRDAFVCEACGEHDLSSTELAIHQSDHGDNTRI